MLDLNKESFCYNGWHFEFYRSPKEMYKLFVFGKKSDKRMHYTLHVEKPSPFNPYYHVYLNEWLDKAEKEAIKVFKVLCLKGELELLWQSKN